MNDWELPEDLQRLEDELMALPRPLLPSSLLPGLDREMRVQLRGEHLRRWYGYVAAAAAAALLWANLSLWAATATDFHLAERANRSDARALEDQLHELLPELDARELRRQVVMLRANSYLTPRAAQPARTVRPGRLQWAEMDQLF